MIEKRFTLDYIQSTWWRITDNSIGKSIENKERMIVDWLNSLNEENERLQQEKEYYREYAIKYLTEYELHSDKFLNILKDIMCEEDFKKIKEEENKIIEALKKEGLYE